MTTLNLQVQASADDIFHISLNGHIFLPNGASFAAGRSFVGVGTDLLILSVARFISVTIPQGLTVDAASITLTCNLARAGTVVRTNISAEDVDDADIVDSDAETDALVRTAAIVPWDGLPAWIVDAEYTSPDLAVVIQEIVDRGGWLSGNAINIIWEDDGSDADLVANRTGHSYDGDTAKAPKLDIDYSGLVEGSADLTGVGALTALGYDIIPYRPGMCWPRADLFCSSEGDVGVYIVPGVGVLYVRRGEAVPAGLERSLGGFIPS